MELWPALGALTSVLRGELKPGDVMQVNVSSRATASTHLAATSCRLAGAMCRLLGILSPDEALDGLTHGEATLLLTVPSYLAELVHAARRRGLGPGDFRLRRVTVGGEVLSPSLAEAACQTFGVPLIEDPYSMTEVIPVTGRTCSQRHLHHDVNIGRTERLDLRTGEPAAAGALATLAITPYFPYRGSAPVFRFDTRDVVRCLPDDALGCELAGIPATSQILGKADHLLCCSDGDLRETTFASEPRPRHRDLARVHLRPAVPVRVPAVLADHLPADPHVLLRAVHRVPPGPRAGLDVAGHRPADRPQLLDQPPPDGHHRPPGGGCCGSGSACCGSSTGSCRLSRTCRPGCPRR
jgi:hypothetical protein